MGTTRRARIGIIGSTMKKYDRMMADGGIDYAAEQFGKYQTVFNRTATFDNGYEADLKVNTNRPEDADLWCECVLFDPNGYEVAHSDVSWSLGGVWTLWDDDDAYEVEVDAI